MERQYISRSQLEGMTREKRRDLHATAKHYAKAATLSARQSNYISFFLLAHQRPVAVVRVPATHHYFELLANWSKGNSGHLNDMLLRGLGGGCC
jgi:hypothetical protein